MISARVCRGSSYPGECRDGDENLKWGLDISDPLLVTEETVQERGRVEIDKGFTNRKSVDLSLNTVEFIQPGTVVTINEGVELNNGLLRSINLQYSITDNSVSSGSSLKIERNV